MQLYTDTQQLRLHGSCVTIGNFDGVHVGHRTLIHNVLQKSRRWDVPAVVVTFWPHPLQLLAGHHAPPILTNQMERRRLLRELGVNILLELHFDRALAALSPEDFVKNVLVPLRCKELVIGYDFSLGKGRAGNAAVLTHLGKIYGFGVEQLEPVIVRDAVASSSRMRDLMRRGDVWELRAVVGRFHALAGTVIHGYKRGTDLGFPTANIDVRQMMLPRTGVYATWLSHENTTWPSVTNIGINPTFGGNTLSVESHMLDGHHDLYDAHVNLHLVQRVRDEQRFDSPEALKAHIHKDVTTARNILESCETT